MKKRKEPEEKKELEIKLPALPPLEEQNSDGYMPEILEAIYKSIVFGLTLADAAKLLRLNPKKLLNWYNNNYYEFQTFIDEALTINKQIHVRRVTVATEGIQVKSSQWWLERRYKEEFTKETVITVNHIVIDNIAQVVAATLIKFIPDPELLKAAAEELYENLKRVKDPGLDQTKILEE